MRRVGGPAIHPDVVRLGIVSLLTDVSSEMIFSVFAVFFTTVAGASAVLLGAVEGLADLSSCSLDYLAGWLSDRAGRRKPLALLGYGFSAMAKAILLLASTVSILASFRVLERLGKSFRGPPRDAWLSAVAERKVRGYSFGVHKALDKCGAVLGPLARDGVASDIDYRLRQPVTALTRHAKRGIRCQRIRRAARNTSVRFWR